MKVKTLPIRWGMIGCGSVTEVKSAPAYQQTEGFVINAVMSRTLSKAEAYAERHGIPIVYSDAQDLINDPAIDAVYVATPPDSHKEYGLMVAKAGKPCCIEKPLAPTYSNCVEIVEAFKESNTPLFVAYYRRSLPRFLKVKSWLDEKRVGEIRHIRWNLTRPPKPIDLSGDYNWRTDPKIAPGGYFDDLASHGLDLFAFLLGDYHEVRGIATNQQKLYGAKDAITASWIHKNGATGSGSWHFGCDRYEDLVEIYGSSGKITFSVFGEVPLMLETQMGREEVFIKNPKHVQQFHVGNLKKQLIQGDFQHPSTGESALHTAWVMGLIFEKI